MCTKVSLLNDSNVEVEMTIMMDVVVVDVELKMRVKILSHFDRKQTCQISKRTIRCIGHSMIL